MTDSLGYKCGDPPVWMRIMGQDRKFTPGYVTAERIKVAKREAAIEYLLDGHTTDEVGKRFHRRSTTIADEAREAGCVYNQHMRRWEMG